MSMENDVEVYGHIYEFDKYIELVQLCKNCNCKHPEPIIKEFTKKDQQIAELQKQLEYEAFNHKHFRKKWEYLYQVKKQLNNKLAVLEKALRLAVQEVNWLSEEMCQSGVIDRQPPQKIQRFVEGAEHEIAYEEEIKGWKNNV